MKKLLMFFLLLLFTLSCETYTLIDYLSDINIRNYSSKQVTVHLEYKQIYLVRNSVSCYKDSYDTTQNSFAYSDGYDDGYADGKNDSLFYTRREIIFTDDDGYSDDYKQDYGAGYSDGNTDGNNEKITNKDYTEYTRDIIRDFTIDATTDETITVEWESKTDTYGNEYFTEAEMSIYCYQTDDKSFILEKSYTIQRDEVIDVIIRDSSFYE